MSNFVYFFVFVLLSISCLQAARYDYKTNLCNNEVSTVMHLTYKVEQDEISATKNPFYTLQMLIPLGGKHKVQLERIFRFFRVSETCDFDFEASMFYSGPWKLQVAMTDRIKRIELVIDKCSRLVPVSKITYEMMYFIAFDQRCNESAVPTSH